MYTWHAIDLDYDTRTKGVEKEAAMRAAYKCYCTDKQISDEIMMIRNSFAGDKCPSEGLSTLDVNGGGGTTMKWSLTTC